ncbi:hypothetical protein V6N11_051031 [Hibiscus sabdariffa]|uniref:Uncharacterized protein n=1 Tax=Hibiscus sabdariffa TaxID=183260 RepID=A0ABR2R2N2_9ROSI
MSSSFPAVDKDDSVTIDVDRHLANEGRNSVAEGRRFSNEVVEFIPPDQHNLDNQGNTEAGLLNAEDNEVISRDIVPLNGDSNLAANEGFSMNNVANDFHSQNEAGADNDSNEFHLQDRAGGNNNSAANGGFSMNDVADDFNLQDEAGSDNDSNDFHLQDGHGGDSSSNGVCLRDGAGKDGSDVTSQLASTAQGRFVEEGIGVVELGISGDVDGQVAMTAQLDGDNEGVNVGRGD